MYLVMSGSVELFVSKNELVLRTMTVREFIMRGDF